KCINLSSAGTTSNEGQSSYASKNVELTSSLIDENYMIGLSEDIINEKLIKKLCKINFDNNLYSEDIYPKFKFNDILSENKDALISRIEKLYNMGLIDSTSEAFIDFVMSIDNLPKNKDENTEMDILDNEQIGRSDRGIDKNNIVLGSDRVSNSKDLSLAEIPVLNYSEYLESDHG